MDTRPTECRFRLADEGKAYPKSSCTACGRSVTTGLGKSCSQVGDAPAEALKDTRPDWGFKEMSESDFRKVHEFGLIVSIKAEWKFTSADTSDEWLTATRDDGATLRMPRSWPQAFKFEGKSHVPGLFGFTYLGERMRKRWEEINDWEKKNAKDRSEFERLKAKFENSQ